MRQKELHVAVLFAVFMTCQLVVGSPVSADRSADRSASNDDDPDAILFGLCGDDSRHGIEVVDGRPCNGGSVPPPVQMMRLHVDSLVQARYAHTVVSSTVTNFVHSTHTFNFSLAIPDTAMVSGFILELDGDIYKAHPTEKKNITIHTFSQSSVDISIRNAVTFDVVLTLEPRKTVEFTLMYEELLPRKLGRYSNIVHLKPGQIVPDLQVRFFISESTDLSAVEVNPLSNDVHDVNNTLAAVSRPSPKTAEVVFRPSMSEQKQLAEELNADPNLGLNGHISVAYDVDRYPTGGDIIVKDDHFAHFFAPTNLSYISKHALFVLDVSGSMEKDLKIEHLRQAMIAILSELSPDDSFTVIQFSSTYVVWDLGTTSNDVSFSCKVYPATSVNIEMAQAQAAKMTAGGSTAMNGALQEALECAKDQAKRSDKAPILLFLTDGEPSDDTPETILESVSAANLVDGSPLASIYSLAFGADADLSFLRRLSLSNGGDAQAIYEATDASEQLQDFYQTISTPLLRDVTVTFDYENVDNATLTQSDFRTYFKGSELVVAGRMAPGKRTLKGKVTAKGAGGAAISYEIASVNLDWWKPRLLDGTPALERLWAFLKVSQELDDEMSQDKVEADLYSETTALALQYSFVTPSTCLVVDWRNPEPSTIPPAPTNPTTSAPPVPSTGAPPVPSTGAPSTEAPPAPSTSAPPVPSTAASPVPSTAAPPAPSTAAPSTAAPSSVAPPTTPPPVTVSTTVAPGPCKPGSGNSISIGTIHIDNLSISGPLFK